MTIESDSLEETENQLLGEVGPRRVIAFVIDNYIGFASAICFAKLLLSENPLVNGVLLVIGYTAYFIIFEAIFSKTFGKWVTGLRVQRIDGEKCGVISSLIRNVTRLLEANPFLFGIYPAAIVMFFSRKRQRLGDQWAKTLVIRSDN